MLLLGAVLETIAKENLLEATQAAGDTLLKGSCLITDNSVNRDSP